MIAALKKNGKAFKGKCEGARAAVAATKIKEKKGFILITVAHV